MVVRVVVCDGRYYIMFKVFVSSDIRLEVRCASLFSLQNIFICSDALVIVRFRVPDPAVVDLVSLNG